MADVSAIIKRNDEKRKFTIAMVALSVLVVTVVFWWLRLAGITQTSRPGCGKEEHTHTEECIERVLICGFDDESEGDNETEDTTEAVSETEAESETENESETVTESESESETETATESESESESETDTETGTTDEAVSETEATDSVDEVTEVTEAETTEETQVHIHTDSCYTIIYNCDGNGNELEEHEHTSDCYPDVEADLETAEVWESTLPAHSGIWEQDMMEIAKSQISVQESELNYFMDDDWVKHGITRYGQWYGEPYADWNAIFACFCLNYAGYGGDTIPYDPSCYAWSLALKQTSFWKRASSNNPVKGELMFVDTDNDNRADRVGVIIGISDSKITVVEGDIDNAVSTRTYNRATDNILGYVLPAAIINDDIEWIGMTDEEKVAHITAEIAALDNWVDVKKKIDKYNANNQEQAKKTYCAPYCNSVNHIIKYYRALSKDLRLDIVNDNILYIYMRICST